MTIRSASATIKGYLYQFDHSIVQLLSAANGDASVVLEGIEDVDLTDGGDEILIQCKYYEGTEYNHSVIKPAIIQMVRHFHAEKSMTLAAYRYRLYGHYSHGQEKLPNLIGVDFLKENFLTYVAEKRTHEIHKELKLTDSDLQAFLDRFEANISGLSYTQQQSEVETLLMKNVPGCQKEDVAGFFYPIAANAIHKLVIGKTDSERTTSKRAFIDTISKKELVFDRWLRRKFGDEYYERSVKRKYFAWNQTKIPKKARLFIIDLKGEFAVEKVSALMAELGRKFSHVEHARTPAADRFCPYVHIRGLSRDELINVKGKLIRSGVRLVDGHDYDGAPFAPESLLRPPTKDNPIQLKFIGLVEHIASVITLIRDTEIDVFDFFKDTPIDGNLIPSSAMHNCIKVDSAFVIQKVI